jgi:hypothetical protein
LKNAIDPASLPPVFSPKKEKGRSKKKEDDADTGSVVESKVRLA